VQNHLKFNSPYHLYSNALCPVRDNMLVENVTQSPATRPVRDGMWIFCQHPI
jgi:hypothetical protein